LHPGEVRAAGAVKFVGENVSLLDESMEPVEGAMTSLFAATSPKVWQERDRYGGAYLMPFGVVVEESENARDEHLAEELRVTSERVVNDVLSVI